MKKITIISVIVLLGLSSCRVFNPGKMLRTGMDFKYNEAPKDSNQIYRIAPNDVISLQLFTNDGEKLVDPTAFSGGIAASVILGPTITAVVEYDGMVKVPVIGRVKLQGLTLRDAELFFEEKYSAYFNRPYINLKVTNNRVFLFKGGNNSSVIPLLSPNTSLFELIAQTGGISDGKAHRIKLIRNTAQGSQVFLIDLSRAKNISQGNIILQANDVVYIEPRTRVAQETMTALTPYLSLFTTILMAYGIFYKK